MGFADTVSIDNGRVSLKPYMVAVPTGSADVAKIVKYCHTQDVLLTTKAGGHSSAGYCLNAEGVVMDLAEMNNIDFLQGGSQLTVGAGTRWIRAYAVRDRQSKYTAIGGGCAGVGVAGFILGGATASFRARTASVAIMSPVWNLFPPTARSSSWMTNPKATSRSFIARCAARAAVILE